MKAVNKGQSFNFLKNKKMSYIKTHFLLRFHGAFTGGFSAGYFNSVDTKEGWTPSSFKSSRAERGGGDTSKTYQKPEDFMDDEVK